MFTEWEGVSLDACFGKLELSNLSKPGRPAGVVQNVDDPAVFIFLNPDVIGVVLGVEKREDTELLGMARSLSL